MARFRSPNTYNRTNRAYIYFGEQSNASISIKMPSLYSVCAILASVAINYCLFRYISKQTGLRNVLRVPKWALVVTTLRALTGV